MDEREVKKRLQMVLSSHSENPNSLARRCNANQKTLNNQINGETAVSLSTILLVLEALPDVSTEWLLRGKGDMLISEGQSGNQVTSNSHNVTTNSHNETHVNTSLSVSSLLDMLARRDEQIQTLLELLRK